MLGTSIRDGYTSSLVPLLLIAVLLLLSACAAQTRLDAIAADAGFGRSIIDSGTFRHLIYSHNIAASQYDVLHVYLEGDGNPWIRPNIIAVDPTGRKPLAMQLMALDKNPSVYIGRPCYHGFYKDKPCNPKLWTHARYAQPVVTSMRNVLRMLIKRLDVKSLYLVGYSGGGVLAMLLSEEIPQVKKVITIAANLDIEAWARLHNYSPLVTSLNPAKRLEHYQNLIQHHLAGGLDENVPLQIIRQFVDRQDARRVKMTLYDKFNHSCCWVSEWPNIVPDLEK
ncbi:MAG: alpha/beta hydrolase [Thiohalomonadales bacterium]